MLALTAPSRNGSRRIAADCIVCGAPRPEPVVELPPAPVNVNRLWGSEAAARAAPRGTVELGFCSNCGHLFNLRFDPDLITYDEEYENSQIFSARFRDYAESLARRLVHAHGLHGADIVEIGGGRGDFLALLCALGDNRGVNVDPSSGTAEQDRLVADLLSRDGRIRCVPELYSERHASLAADLIVCRHTLEHVWDPVELVDTVRLACGRRRVPVYFEVPNGSQMLRDGMIADLVYPHCSYFTRESIMRLFGNSGFSVQHVRELFDGQFLGISLLPKVGTNGALDHASPATAVLADDVAAFAETTQRKLREWRDEVGWRGGRGERIAVWGAGAKAVTFLNVVEECHRIETVVDVSPRKTGCHLPGTGQRIARPEALLAAPPDVVFVMNPAYVDEIRVELERMEIVAEVCVI